MTSIVFFINVLVLAVIGTFVLRRAARESDAAHEEKRTALENDVLDYVRKHEAAAPTFAKLVRDQYTFLTPIAWATSVRREAATASLSPEVRSELLVRLNALFRI